MALNGPASSNERDIVRKFWGLLTKTRRPATCFKADGIQLDAVGNLSVQPFEVLVVATLKELCPEMDWTVTQVQGDGGIDFIGQAAPIHLAFRQQEVPFRYVVVGQVKRVSTFRGERVSKTFDDIADKIEADDFDVSQVLFVISTEDNFVGKYESLAKRLGKRHLPGTPINVLDASEFVMHWANNIDDTMSILGNAFTQKDKTFVQGFLEQQQNLPNLQEAVTNITAPSGPLVVNGRLHQRVSIQCNPVLDKSVLVKVEMDEALLLTAPIAAAGNWVKMPLDEDGRARLDLYYRARWTGQFSIGRVLVSSSQYQNEASIAEHELGSVAIGPDENFRHIRYISKPHLNALEAIHHASNSAGHRQIETLAILGEGGIGKSRLIAEALSRLNATTNDGALLWSTISVSRDTQRVGDSGFLKELALEIAFPDTIPGARSNARTEQSFTEWITRYLGTGNEIALSGVKSIFDVKAPQKLDEVAFVLMAAILARLRQGHLAIHVGNLHWADAFEVDVICQLLIEFSKLENQVSHGLMVMFEGRRREMLDERSEMTTEAWRRLYDAKTIRRRIELPSWSKEDCGDLVRQLLRALSVDRTLSADTERSIRESVLRAAVGNPMAIIERFRFLLESKSIVLSKEGDIAFAPLVEELLNLTEVSKRVQYFTRQPQNAQSVAVLKACAEIGMTTDSDVMEAMKGACDGQWPLSDLSEWGSYSPSKTGSAEFAFLHESYREAFLCTEKQGDLLTHICRAATIRLMQAKAYTPARIIALCRLQRHLAPSDEEQVEQLAQVLAVAEKHNHNPQAQIALRRQALMYPKHIFVASSTSKFDETCKLVDDLITHGDWREALIWLESAEESLETFNDADHARLAHRFGNVLGDMNDTRRAIEYVGNSLQTALFRGNPHRTQKEQHNFELLQNRFGVLRWFSGRLDEGIGHIFRAFRSSRRANLAGASDILFSCELGMAMMHRYPNRGRSLLKHSARHYLDHRGQLDQSLDYSVVQHQLAELIGANLDKTSYVLEALRTFLGGSIRPSIYAEALGSLVACAAAFKSKDVSASLYFAEESIRASERANNERLRWKAHLAKATVSQSSLGAHAGAAHALIAGDMLMKSHERAPYQDARAWYQTIRLPLEHVSRLTKGEPSEVSDFLARWDTEFSGKPGWIEDWSNRPGAISKAGQPFQILHERVGDDDIFLMG